MRITVLLVLVEFCWVFYAQGVMAARFVLPQNGDTVVGHLQLGEVRGSDTLPDVARRYNVGFNEIIRANPGMDAWMPNPEPDNGRLLGTGVSGSGMPGSGISRSGDSSPDKSSPATPGAHTSGKNGVVLIPSVFILPPKPWEGIIVNLAEMRLYYFPPAKKNQPALVKTYPLAIGQDNLRTPMGVFHITDKIDKPSWTVPASIVAEDGLSRYGHRRIVPGGDDENPLGEHALMLDEPGYLIHGTNKPYSIGRRVSRGCLRMYPEDIDELFSEVARGTVVRIINERFKVGRRHGMVYVEAHYSNYVDGINDSENFTALVSGVIAQAPQTTITPRQWRRLNRIASQYSGLPAPFISLRDAPDLRQQWYVRLRKSSDMAQSQPVEQLLQRLLLPYAKYHCSDSLPSCATVGPLENRHFAEAAVEVLGAQWVADPAITSVPRR